MAGSLAMLMASLAAFTEREFLFLDADGANRGIVEIVLTTGDDHLVRHACDVPQAVHPRRRQPRDRRIGKGSRLSAIWRASGHGEWGQHE